MVVIDHHTAFPKEEVIVAPGWYRSVSYLASAAE
jgi:hypothetical protein